MPFAVVRRYCLHLHFHLNKYPYFWCFNAKAFVHIQVHILHNTITVLHLSKSYEHICKNRTRQCLITIKILKMFWYLLSIQKNKSNACVLWYNQSLIKKSVVLIPLMPIVQCPFYCPRNVIFTDQLHNWQKGNKNLFSLKI